MVADREAAHLAPFEGHDERYGAKEKFFGDKAERISREEYPAVVKELVAKAAGHFQRLEPHEQLEDKEDFGDVDFVALAGDGVEDGEGFFRKIFGADLLDYHHEKAAPGKENVLYTLLVKLSSGKQVQVDVTKAKSEEDFERKKTYYSRGHLSSFIGVVAKNLGFTYGTEGFFKKYCDSKGQWHNILITGDLKTGLKVLGYDTAAYESVKTLDDCLAFLTSSPYFDSRYFDQKNMVRRDKEALRRSTQQQYLRGKLPRDQRQKLKDEKELQTEIEERLGELLPGWDEAYRRETERIEAEIARRAAERRRRLAALDK